MQILGKDCCGLVDPVINIWVICMKNKVSRNEFLDKVSVECGVSSSVVHKVYGGIISVFNDIIRSGRDISLTGFGTFALKKHKGHPVQFDAKESHVKDYDVLKFTPSDVLMNKIRANKES